MRPQRRVRCRTAVALGAVVGAVLLAGCGTGGGLRSAGPTPAAIGPARLWPQLPPASAAPYDYGEGETARVPGIEVPDGDVHRLAPVTVVQADLKARPNRTSGRNELPADTVRHIVACRTEPASCPVLQPYFRDLTGDGEDEMVLGIRMPGRQLSVRVYMPEAGGLMRILSTADAVISVELAGRDLIIRTPSVITGYAYRTAWTWDSRQRAMLPAEDEILRMPASRTPRPKPTAAPPSPGPTTAKPTAAPSVGVSAERR
ncbi:hypothetical protein [Streptomyces sp. NBC_01217]|uniref:hypothetical protein n=1 Tax=Streptomyces sp. NBC_01217 TaxID=2903779 RepID=UPI002E0E7D9F|nr:hypothetical protein OG507_27585 [Streptomyces sp. NBC_01217]